MRTFGSIVLTALIALVLLTPASAKADGPFLSGCVGDCNGQSSWFGSYTITWFDRVGPCGGGICSSIYLLATDGVCPHDSVFVYVKKNGSTLFSRLFNSWYDPSPFSTSITANADVGDVITLEMNVTSIGEDVVCKRYGSLSVDLEL